ncbi:MAG TPA: hypothetical protein VF712_07055 [Thermoleophilaceae bacterium]
MPIGVADAAGFDHAELVFEGVEQAGPSFEGRVFVNNPNADERTEKTPANGYVGSFHVFGFGGLAADTGEGAAGGARLPGTQRVKADAEALRAAMAGSEELTVKVVPVPADPAPQGLPVPLVGTVALVLDPAR